jgi:hypothetical protein
MKDDGKTSHKLEGDRPRKKAVQSGLGLKILTRSQSFEPKVDEKGLSRCFRPEYCLGDVLFVETGPRRLPTLYRPNSEDVHLGNDVQ